ncbi:MAG: hypothetical protein IJI07_04390 [Flexilinea sp.]|nr:hypothetical protein [Flexilinea sp.]
MKPTTINQLAHQILEARRLQGDVIRSLDTALEESQVYIGLNDSETRQQKFETGRYVTILKDICREFGVPFSFDIQEGGYVHDDGEFTEEKSIVLTFIDVPQETVDRIAKEACILFHQESVLVTTDRIHARSIREVL